MTTDRERVKPSVLARMLRSYAGSTSLSLDLSHALDEAADELLRRAEPVGERPPNAIRPARVWADGTVREWWVDDGDGPRVVVVHEPAAPQEPVGELDDDGLRDQVALEVLCRVFDDDPAFLVGEWDAFIGKGGWLHWSRALGAFIRHKIEPPAAPQEPVGEPVTTFASHAAMLAEGTASLDGFLATWAERIERLPAPPAATDTKEPR